MQKQKTHTQQCSYFYLSLDAHGKRSEPRAYVLENVTTIKSTAGQRLRDLRDPSAINTTRNLQDSKTGPLGFLKIFGENYKISNLGLMGSAGPFLPQIQK